MAVERLQLLLDHPTIVGIDFVRVEPTTQTTLWIFFLGDDPGGSPDKVDPLQAGAAWTAPGEVTITSTSPDSRIPEVEITSVSWEPLATFGKRALRVETATPGDFSIYTLELAAHDALDPYYAAVRFTFKAGCESRLDCKPKAREAPEDEPVDVAVDYTARDWKSYRRALLELVSLRHPHWKDRLEADLGVMFLETLAALADELTYTQDRFAREAHLETATQRRSVRRHARFVDYELHDGLAASTWLLVQAARDQAIEAGSTATVTTDAGEDVVFEVGTSITDITERRDPVAPRPYVVTAALSELAAHIWDEDDTCLPAGSTELVIVWPGPGSFTATFGLGPRRLLLWVRPTDPALPVLRHWVVVDPATGIEELTDPLLVGVDLVRLSWDEAWATTRDLDLEHLTVHGNVIPIVAGAAVPPWSDAPATFVIRKAEEAWTWGTHAVEREARPLSTASAAPCAEATDGSTARTVAFSWSLAGTDQQRLCWVPADEQAIGEDADPSTLGRAQRPEVWLAEQPDEDSPLVTWTWRRSLLGSPSSTAVDTHYTLDDGLWEEVVRYWRDAPEPIRHIDYRTGEGSTIRFGDGELGLSPPRGRTFHVRFRLGGGERGNLPAGRAFTLTHPNGTSLAVTATNPTPITNGLEPETLAAAKRDAPEAWKSSALRAVTTDDYARALERLEEVDRAGAALRWTGSWPTLFATPDPVGTVTLTKATRGVVEAQLERFRQAGRQAFVRDPVYAWLDLRLKVCVDERRYRGEVEAEIRAALVGTTNVAGFFAPASWTFGDPLHRSALEAAIHAVPGVRSVESIEVRRRGFFDWQALAPEGLEVEDDVVIGLSDDPEHPERGSLELELEGGA